MSASSQGVDPDWRTFFAQSKRTAEARALAKELASLEPGASEASKLRLAMQVEDVVFKQATSEADYRKRLAKRLNKVKKSYKPVVVDNSQKKESMIQELRTKYGDSLTYIVQNAQKAVNEMRSQKRETDANSLQKHTDLAVEWAKELGFVATGTTTPNYKMPDSMLQTLQKNLPHHLARIRSNVVRVVDPDLYFKEKLHLVEESFKDKKEAVRLQSGIMRNRYAQVQKKLSSTDQIDSKVLLSDALEQATKPVPIVSAAVASSQSPQSSNSTTIDNTRQKAALVHLDKMRGASSVLLAYLLAPDKYEIPRNTLTKAHDVAIEGIDFVKSVMKEVRQKESQNTAEVKLQDAWLKALELPSNNDSPDDDEASQSTSATAPVALRSRVLLTAGRHTPGNLIPALQSKGAKLIRPPPTGAGSHLEIEFGEAFVMTIYFTPLLVTLRAYQKKEDSNNDDGDDDDDDTTMDQYKCASWTPLHHGLLQREQELVVGADVKGTYETVGLAVQERLRDASARATRTLRQCFGAVSSSPGSEFDIEILEASALLEFVALARATYTPNWNEKVGSTAK